MNSPRRFFLLIVLVLAVGCSARHSNVTRRRMHPNRMTIRVGLILPVNDDRPFSIQKSIPAIQIALSSNEVMKRLLPGCRFDLYTKNSKCNSIAAPIAAFELMETIKVHVIFGPVCDYSLAPVACYSPYWDTPVISPGGMATDFGANKTEEKAEFKLLTRIGITFEDFAIFMYSIVSHFNWKNIKVLYSADGHSEVASRFCNLAISAISRHFNTKNIETRLTSFEQREEDEDIENILLNQIGLNFSVVIMCNSPDSVRKFMIQAAELNFINGDYVFINIDLFSSKKDLAKNWYRANDSDERNELAKKAYEAMLMVTVKQPENAELYQNFSETLKYQANKRFNEIVYEPDEEVNILVGAFHDAVILYAHALNETLTEGLRPENGSVITKKMWNRTINGISGKVTIDENGDRTADYSLMDMDPDSGEFKVVADYNDKLFIPDPDRKIHWGGPTPYVTPLDFPRCGYDNSRCPPSEHLPQYAIVVISVLGSAVVVLLGALFCFTDYKSKKKRADKDWRIRWEDILFGAPEKRKLDRRNSSINYSMISYNSCESMTFLGRDEAFTKTGSYKSTLVAIKKISKPVNLTKQLLSQLKTLRYMQDDHIVRFIGVCIDPANSCIITEYCQKGSLKDKLNNDQVNLDMMFKTSLVQDIVMGMAYLHSSDIHSHGNLTTSNCVVDSRFVLKITDFGLHSLRGRGHLLEKDPAAYYQGQLWTAPELLRMTNRPLEGTQKGDLYSFGIICQEILYRRGPFWIENSDLCMQDIICRVKQGVPPVLRPTLSPDSFDMDICCNIELVQMINRCWSEEPNDRPDFPNLKMIMAKRNNIRKETGSLLDNLLSRLEQYALNLETLVEERTVDYLEQKKRAEEILYLMLPRSVAVQLMFEETVQAEKFECVTICFCDICGFTALSAASTPMQIVNMLNELYTKFDLVIDTLDVYKVETIGDAYMVASGLPLKNGLLHASEISHMSLSLLDIVKSFKIPHRPHDHLELRTGIHSGPVCAGVVGMKMPRYCLFGDTVNTALSMQTLSEPLRIHVSHQTKDILDTFETFDLERRGTIFMPGKGAIETWWLNGDDENHQRRHTREDHATRT